VLNPFYWMDCTDEGGDSGERDKSLSAHEWVVRGLLMAHDIVKNELGDSIESFVRIWNLGCEMIVWLGIRRGSIERLWGCVLRGSGRIGKQRINQ
jgi:hypothetical protein